MMRRLAPLLACLAGIMLLLRALTPAPSPKPTLALPPGWALIRPPHDVNALLVERDNVWAGGTEGVWAIDRRTRTVRPVFPTDSGPRHVRALIRDTDGALLIGHDAGVMRFVGGEARPLEAEALPPGRVLSFLLARGGALWIGTERGVAVRDGSGWQVLRAKDGLLSDVVNAMAQDDDGGIWFGSYNIPGGGVSRLFAGRFQHWTPAEGLPHASVTSLLRDGASRVWAGTGMLDRGGLACFEKAVGGWRVARVLGQAEGLAGAKVRSLFRDREGRLWAGSEYEGLAFLDRSGWKVRRAIDGLAHDEVKAISQDEDGAIWIGTKDGVTVISRIP